MSEEKRVNEVHQMVREFQERLENNRKLRVVSVAD